MSKYGTVLICDDQTDRPYDIQSLNVITYPLGQSGAEFMMRLKEYQNRIASSIKATQEKKRADSPVFDVFGSPG